MQNNQKLKVGEEKLKSLNDPIRVTVAFFIDTLKRGSINDELQRARDKTVNFSYYTQ